MTAPSFGPAVTLAAQQHAMAEWPRESVGFVLDGTYVPQMNVAADKLTSFKVDDAAWSDAVEAVIHSHPGSTFQYPSSCAPGKTDLVSQRATDVPWGITACDGKIASPLFWFGAFLLDEPLIGRPFVPGAYDCYELVRAFFKQERGIFLPDYPRDTNWMDTDPGLLEREFRGAGFIPVAQEEVREGDCMLMSIPAGSAPNHCAILLGGNVMLHHCRGELSRREPWSGAWRRITRTVVRYAGGAS